MAVLPGEEWIMQQIDGDVVLFHAYTEEEVVRFNPSDGDETAKSQKVIYDSERLNDEQKAFAYFWSGYFYAHAN
jgi:hypothetical protein